MSFVQWESLAEVYFNISGYKGDENYIYCLCSRVFCRNNFDVLTSALECDEDSKKIEPSNEFLTETHVHFSLDTSGEKPCEKDVENLSCYCSASHTDNYYSTDEHETPVVSILTSRFCKDIQSSDSGADLSEYGFQDSPRVPEVKKHSHNDLNSTLVHEDFCHESNSKENEIANEVETNYLDCSTWERYWAINGERLIWASWVEKYSEYINPQYSDKDSEKCLNYSDNPGSSCDFRNKSTEHISTKRNSLTQSDVYPNHNCVITVDNGWNPLSPTSFDEIWNIPRSTEQDHLLSPRCPSSNSIPNTIGTTDSMTNVTQMTVSSYELNSSTVSSESSKDSSEAAISIDSRDSNPWSDHLGNLSAPESEDTMDADQYWQILWKKHFEELYAKHYALYLAEHMLADNNEKLNMIQACNSESKKKKGKPSKEKQKSRRYLNSVGALLQNLSATKINESEVKSVKNSEFNSQAFSSTYNGTMQYSEDLNLEVCRNGISHCVDCPVDSDEPIMNKGNTELNTMSTKNEQESASTSNGYKINSNSSQAYNKQDGDEDPPEENRPISLKRSHESDTEEPNLDKAKAAFSLMGFAFSDANMEKLPLIKGEVVYKKRNIRLQNRYLKMKHNKSILNTIEYKPVHIYFDDQGNCTKTPDNVLNYNASSSDEESATKINKKSSLQVVSNTNLELTEKDQIKNNLSLILNSSTHGSEFDIDVDFENPENNTSCINTSVKELKTDLKNTVLITKDDEHQSLLEDVTVNNRSDANKTRREKKKRKKPKKNLNLPSELANDQNLTKYWYKRYSLFSRFDQGIQLDAESWYSVTPEKVAFHTAQRCRCDLIIDAFCGAGGNAIQFAMTCERVIAIDVDPAKISIAKHNANIYGVADRIEFIVGDFLRMADSLIADVVFLSPPWGGPQYLKDENYDLEKHLCPVPGSQLITATKKITQNIAIFLPRNTNVNQLVMMAGPGGSVEIEQNFLDKKLIALTALYGELLNE